MSGEFKGKLLVLAAFLALIAGALMTPPARADIFRSADLSFSEGEHAGSYVFSAVVPEEVAGRSDITLPEGCSQAGMTRQSAEKRAYFSYEIECAQPLAEDSVIGAPWRVDGARLTINVDGNSREVSLVGQDEGLIAPVGSTRTAVRTLPELAPEYLWQGMTHIWFGWDHLAFVLCLCLLAKGRRLLMLVTAFTLGHSVSLAAAFLEVISVPIPPVEAVIALSIAFMAREALKADGPEATARTAQLSVVTGFGLVHGLGFASALEELGVSHGERVASLVFFNLGVEFGQLVFVVAATAVMWLLERVSLQAPVRVASLYFVGAIGCFWMIERVASFTAA